MACKCKNILIIFLSAFLVYSPLKAQNNEGSGESVKDEPVKEDLPQPKPASFGRALLGISFVIGPGLLWYYYDNSNRRDQIMQSKNDIIGRFTSLDAVKYDDNVYETNAVSHSFAGGLYYLSARSSGFNMWQSFLFSLGGSAVWEYLVEFKEIVSINDMIHTPLGGFTMGESLFQLASFYSANVKGQNWFNDFISGNVDVSKYKYSGGLGQASPVWHNLIGFLGILTEKDGSTGGKIGFDTELFGVRNLKRSGSLSGFKFDSPYTKAVLSAAMSKNGVQEIVIYTETGIMGYAKQRIKSNHGYSVFLGINTAFDYNNRNFDKFHDKIGAIHLLGPAADISLVKGDFTLRLRNSAFGDFAMVESPGLKAYYEAGNTKQDVTNMGAVTAANAGYYFALGFTDTALITADYRSFQLGGGFNYSRYRSLNGDGRTNNEPKRNHNFVMNDTRITGNAWLQYSAENYTAYRLGASYAYLKGTADGYSKTINALRCELLAMYRI